MLSYDSTLMRLGGSTVCLASRKVTLVPRPKEQQCTKQKGTKCVFQQMTNTIAPSRSTCDKRFQAMPLQNVINFLRY